MRSGNAILNVVVQVAVIAIVAALLVWVLNMVGAPPVVMTIVWILAVVAILVVVLQLLSGGIGARGGHRRPRP